MITEGKIENLPILDELKDSYLNYAMSVIVQRALPDVRDGLKPSQRRLLYAMRLLLDKLLLPSVSASNSIAVDRNVGVAFIESAVVISSAMILFLAI